MFNEPRVIIQYDVPLYLTTVAKHVCIFNQLVYGSDLMTVSETYLSKNNENWKEKRNILKRCDSTRTHK